MACTQNTTKEKLLETAIDLIWQSSYGSVGVDDICKTAGVNKGSFYHYFPSKVDLALAAMDVAFQKFAPVLEEIFSPDIPPLKRFEKLADHAYQKQKDAMDKYGMVCGCAFATLGSEMAPQEDSIRNKTQEIMECHQKHYEQALIDLVDEGLLPADTDIAAKANKIRSFIMGQFLMGRIQNSLEPMKKEMKSGILELVGAHNKVLENA